MSLPVPPTGEVLIVGGGPAGSTAALLLARAGRDVLLVEKRLEGQGKVCGEFTSAEGVAVLRRSGILDILLSAGAMPIARTCIHAQRGETFESPLPVCEGHSGLGVSRRLLDETLLAEACGAGARILRGARIVRLSREGGVWKARILWRGNPVIVAAPVVLGADGRNSRVASLAGLGGSFTEAGLGLQLHLRRRATPQERVELFLLREGYAGLAPVEPDRWCLGALLSPSRDPANPFRRLVSALTLHPRTRDLLRVPEDLLDRASAYPVRMGMRRAALPGLLLVGDAAGFVDPFSGQGISLALMGGEAAAQAVQGMMEGRSAKGMRGYGAFLRRELGARMVVTASFRSLLARPGWTDGLVRTFRRHPELGRHAVGLTRNVGFGLLGSLPRLAARLLAP